MVGYVVQTYCNKGKPGVAVNKEPSDGKLQHRRPFDFLSWIVYIVPAALYSLNNNLVVHIQHYTDPATFQVLSNMKVPATALMYRLFIRRRIPRNKQAALLLLTIVGMSCSYSGVQAHREFMKTKTMNTEGGIEEDKGMHDFGSMRRHLSVVGLLLILLYASISAFAGVYTELIMKNRAKTSIHFQNMQLSSFGIIFNIVGFLMITDPGSSFFSGYSIWTALIIGTQAANGLMIASMLKFSSNLTRLLIVSCATVLTTYASHLVFHLALDYYFYFALCLLFPALLLYELG